VAFITPGVRHAAGNAGDTVARVIEIYAPAGQDFHIVDDEDKK
jgi:quercetin dioxygenase-like cupin family protein